VVKLYYLVLTLALPAFVIGSEEDSSNATGSARWHVVIGFSGSNLSASNKLRATYNSSEYPFVGTPQIYNSHVGLQRSVTERVRLGAEVKFITNQTYRASNWYKVATRTPPEARFDVFETVSGVSNDFLLHFVVVPLKYPVSRFEIAVTSGLSVSHVKETVQHKYVFCRPPGCSQDTTFTKNAATSLFGGFLGFNMDFYWTRYVSSQFRITGRSTSSLYVAPVNYTYAMLDRWGNQIFNERRVQGHRFGFSGVDLSLSLLLHL